MRLLLLNDDEAAFIEEAAELWLTIHAGEWGQKLDGQRVDRMHVLRKLAGKYTEQEREDVAQVALKMLE